MKIYASSSVTIKLDEYVEILIRTCNYNIDEAETRRWEIEYQITQRCNPIVMKAGSSGTIKLKNVLQRQEIERFVNNRLQLISIIKRRRGNSGNTQWIVNYIVSNQGNVYITAIKCYNTFYGSLGYQGSQKIVNECVGKCVRKYGLKEPIEKSNVTLMENTLRHIIQKHIRKTLLEYREKAVGKYTAIDGDGLKWQADSIIQFGWYNNIRMYDSDDDTYCLMRRYENGMYFFTKIVDAPELGKDETKFVPVKAKDVPSVILRDARSLIRLQTKEHNLLC